MMKRTIRLLICATMALGGIAPTMAQQHSSDLSTRKATQSSLAQQDVSLREANNLFDRWQSLGGKSFGFVNKKTSGKAHVPLTLLAKKNGQMKVGSTAGGAEIWVNVTYAPGMTAAADRSISSFRTTNPTELTPLIKGNFLFYNGVGLVDDIIYAGHNAQNDKGEYVPTLYTIDTETWQLLSTTILPDYSLMAFETAMGSDGRIYGAFYSPDGKSKEIGVVDYPTRSRSIIMTTKKIYCALGITKENVLYGVASDGNLYRIDPTTASETLIGATGLTIADAKGNIFFQTGEIDQYDNTFYWLGTDAKKQSTSLYSIDLATGVANELYELGQYTFSSMIIQKPVANDNAPAMVENLSVMFDGANTNGSVSFTAPTTTFAGKPLNDNLLYQVFIDEEVVASGNVTTGTNANVAVSTTEGKHKFDVIVSNANGISPKASVKQWVGYDVPEPVSNIGFELDQSSGSAILYWDGPAKGVNNGYFGGITYDIYRLGGGKEVKVEENFSDTYFEETLPKTDAPVKYSYGIVARNGSQRSVMATSEAIQLGDAYKVPYLENFEFKDKFALWTTIDTYNDKVSSDIGVRGAWIYDVKEKAASYTFGDKKADDWLISPSIKLEEGKTYTIALKAKARAGQTQVYPERFEVFLGTDADPETMFLDVIPDTELNKATYTTFDNRNVSVTSTGKYHIGIHTTSTKDGWTLYVDSVSVELNAVSDAPAATTDLAAVADPTGVLKANISFKAPTKNGAGETLVRNISKIDLRRDNKVITTFTDVQPGSTVQYEDTDVELGNHTYATYPFLDDKQGEKSEVRTYVGVDIPDRARNIKAKDNENSIILSWDKVGTVGANGGLVVPENVDYLVWNTASYNGSVMLYQVIDSIRNGNIATIPFNTNEGAQGLAYLAVQTKNVAGAGDAYMEGILVGAPYVLPFKETLPNGSLTNYWEFNATGAAVSMRLSAESTDGDGYGVEIVSNDAEEYGELYSGKIDLRNAVRPMLIFDARTTAKGNTLGIYVMKPDNTETMVTSIQLDEAFQTYAVDLSAYKNERYIRLGLFESFNAAGKIVFDNINVINALQHDLDLSQFSHPEIIDAGKTAEIKFVVKNYGLQEAKNYTIKVAAGDRLLMNEEITEPLTSLKERNFSVSFPTTIFDEDGEYRLTAEIIYAADEKKDNNKAEGFINILVSQAAPPQNVNAMAEGGKVRLTWQAPQETTEIITQDFEDTTIFEPFSIGGITKTNRNGNFGEWTLIDGDDQLTSFWGAVSYPNSGIRQAWQVINPKKVFGNDLADIDRANSGEQYLISFCPSTGAADDWLISPELLGVPQNLRFSVRCLSKLYGDETYEVLYSTTNKNRESFKKVAGPEVPTMNWIEKSYELPAGTKYFAIRHTAKEAFGLLIDDVKYAVRGGAVAKYNIYVDQQLVATLNADGELAYLAASLADGEHLFSVTAVYANGIESVPVSTKLIVSGIDSITLDSNTLVDVYTLDGKLVRKQTNTLKDLRGVYVINGQKIILK